MIPLLAVTVVSILLAGAAAGQLRIPKTIIVGTVYNIFHEECATDSDFFAAVEKNIALMKASNINHVMIFPLGQWDPDSKQLVWTRTDSLVRNIEQSGMKFVPLMLKEEQCGHYFAIRKFKDIKGMWEEHSLDNGKRNNRQDVDFADPRVYPLLEEYFKAVVERYGKSPALSFYSAPKSRCIKKPPPILTTGDGMVSLNVVTMLSLFLAPFLQVSRYGLQSAGAC